MNTYKIYQSSLEYDHEEVSYKCNLTTETIEVKFGEEQLSISPIHGTVYTKAGVELNTAED